MHPAGRNISFACQCEAVAKGSSTAQDCRNTEARQIWGTPPPKSLVKIKILFFFRVCALHQKDLVAFGLPLGCFV